MKLALTIPGSSSVPADTIASPSGIPQVLGDNPANAATAFFQFGITWLLYIAAALAILVMMWAGIQWITSSGDPIKLASAKRRMTFAVIGLVIAVSAFFIVRLIITILGGNADTFFNFGQALQATPSAALASPAASI